MTNPDAQTITLQRSVPEPTLELRFLDLGSMRPSLQQKWLLPDGREEWRNVPTHIQIKGKPDRVVQ